MSSLTVNLHLLLASFYRPTPGRSRILVEQEAFPSDSYAVQSQAAWHGLDPGEAVLRVPLEHVGAVLEAEGSSIALALLPGVSYLTGEALDIPTLTAAAHAAGAVAAWDLAHAIGNVPLALHDWDVDFAVWCTYKYLNAGPGSPGGAFVHERHALDSSRPRLAGWWGTDPAERFRMEPDFVPQPGAHGFAASTPSILALAPLRASLGLFDRAGFARLRERSLRLTAYLESRVDELPGEADARTLTPGRPTGAGVSCRSPSAARAASPPASATSTASSATPASRTCPLCARAPLRRLPRLLEGRRGASSDSRVECAEPFGLGDRGPVCALRARTSAAAFGVRCAGFALAGPSAAWAAQPLGLKRMVPLSNLMSISRSPASSKK